jgi:hypothetical protein
VNYAELGMMRTGSLPSSLPRGRQSPMLPTNSVMNAQATTTLRYYAKWLPKQGDPCIHLPVPAKKFVQLKNIALVESA